LFSGDDGVVVEPVRDSTSIGEARGDCATSRPPSAYGCALEASLRQIGRRRSVTAFVQAKRIIAGGPQDYRQAPRAICGAGWCGPEASLLALQPQWRPAIVRRREIRAGLGAARRSAAVSARPGGGDHQVLADSYRRARYLKALLMQLA